jgi:hypothetical protein
MKPENEERMTSVEAHTRDSEAEEPTRRGFLQKLAAAGVGSFALAALAEGSGTKPAEADRPRGGMISSSDWTLEVIDLNGDPAVQVTRTFFGEPTFFQRLSANGAASFHIPLGGFPENKKVHGGWWTPYLDMQNLTQWRAIEVGPTADGLFIEMNVRPAPGIKGIPVTIRAFVLHEE